MYRGRQVIDVATRLNKKEEKRKKHEAELKGLNVIKSDKKKKAEPKKEDVKAKSATDTKAKRGMFTRRTPAAKSGEN